MKAKEIRKTFLKFFEGKGHNIVASAPIVNKSDPTLMFTNAGMNQFKDYFLGNDTPSNPRVTDTQKCLRVSGKHNDLEEVGLDGYHHTMFEMLGNWSFGDYFKKEAIDWAWELLTVNLKVDPKDLYATVFGGDEDDDLGVDTEAEEIWKSHLPGERILRCDKKDNFWEMGETGPCGPCSEIHIDMRSATEKALTPGAELVNKDHPEVIEIWNLVFIQYNRSFSGELAMLPEKHIDTGMGFERLCMVLQGKNSSYDTDVFSPIIGAIEQYTGKKYQARYGIEFKEDIAFRVVSDHLRAVAFAIADGQIPSNTGAGYVIRRILRRAVRYYYSFLGCESPLLTRLIKTLVEEMGEAFPELQSQQDVLEKVIEEEENSFLRTLEYGLKRLDQITAQERNITGQEAFELYDTYGFPIDLTLLIAEEKELEVDVDGFRVALSDQKERSRADAKKEVRDWIQLKEGKSKFVGYDELDVEQTRILRFRPFVQKGKTKYQIELELNPFYAEGGGQVGDTGCLVSGDQKIYVKDTQRENDLFLLITDEIFEKPAESVNASVNADRRHLIENNHSATHLLHAALREVLGDHVQQKGSLVRSDALRFDFSHFGKMEPSEIEAVERIVNAKIRSNIALDENRSLPLDEAKAKGAMMLFGEKYGESVRMITFDPSYSRELCGGCHVTSTGKIGLFKISSESSVAAGVRRIEAVTAQGAENLILKEEAELKEIKSLFKTQVNIPQQVADLLESNKALQQKIDELQAHKAKGLRGELESQFEMIGEKAVLISEVSIGDSKVAKDLIYQLEKSHPGRSIVLLGAVINDKPQLLLRISEDIADGEKLHAGKLVKSLARNIKGGGGGQPFYATAGGSDSSGLSAALTEAKTLFHEMLTS